MFSTIIEEEWNIEIRSWS